MELVKKLLQCGKTNTFTMKTEKGREERENGICLGVPYVQMEH
jgi:hypothetical protein